MKGIKRSFCCRRRNEISYYVHMLCDGTLVVYVSVSETQIKQLPSFPSYTSPPHKFIYTLETILKHMMAMENCRW